ncbi:hypothetical protein I350_06715 [Cryptococcus amylolentus CBS 6273]|uniref:Rhodopsin domain-containing protein n=1 Tax=Cryptococcus amylolentus CBS 6273 TaxID=1296118 RepID=A0A1E3JGV1_9TREE|nr:hypothetical protein I350_06715 [Cryptococcus amylolentus CBS 6273]
MAEVQNGLADRHTTVFVVTLVFSVFATAFIGMRMLSKGWIVKRYTLDDWFAVAAWVFSMGVSVSVMIGAQAGLGKMDSVLSDYQSESQKKAIYAFTIFYNLALSTTKTAILILYVRMAAAHFFLRWASIATMAVVNMAGTALVLVMIFRCHPVSAAYTDGGTCMNLISIFLSSSPVNILTDFAILLLPLPILTRLRMEFRQKVVLVATFIVGGFVTVVDVVRVVYLQNALKDEFASGNSNALSTTSGESSKNYGYHISYSLLWSSIEVSVGLMCCCVLVLKPLVLRILPAIIKDPNRTTITSGGLGSFTFGGRARAEASDEEPLRDGRQSSGATNGTAATGITNQNVSHAGEDPGRVNGGSTSTGPQPWDNELDLFAMLASDPPAQPQMKAPKKMSGATVKLQQKYPALFGRHRASASIEASQEPTQAFFDFVQMGGKKSLTELSAKEARTAVLFVSILFFLWGFGYGLIVTLNTQVQKIHGFSRHQAFALNCAYGLAYFIAPPLIGYWVLKKYGFKATFITGLTIYSIGAMAFWPSAVLGSYGGFFVSNLIIAMGLATLETAANPYVALAGPGEFSEARLNFSQAFQAIGAFVAPIIASKALFGDGDVSEQRLFRVQWCYLAVAIFVLFLAIAFFYVPLAEATDQALDKDTEDREMRAYLSHQGKWYGLSTRIVLLCMGVFTLWLYIGAQESLGYFWPVLSRTINPGFDTLWGRTISRGGHAIGRFAAAILCYIGVPPRFIIFFCALGSLITGLVSILAPIGHGTYASLILIEVFESAIFPTVFAITSRNQGRHIKSTSAALIMAASAGAVWPAVAYGIRIHHMHVRHLLIPSVVAWALIVLYPLALSSVSQFRGWIDPKASRIKKDEKVGQAEKGQQLEVEVGDMEISPRSVGDDLPGLSGDRGLGGRERARTLNMEEVLAAPMTMGLGLNLEAEEDLQNGGQREG